MFFRKPQHLKSHPVQFGDLFRYKTYSQRNVAYQDRALIMTNLINANNRGRRRKRSSKWRWSWLFLRVPLFFLCLPTRPLSLKRCGGSGCKLVLLLMLSVVDLTQINHHHSSVATVVVYYSRANRRQVNYRIFYEEVPKKRRKTETWTLFLWFT